MRNPSVARSSPLAVALGSVGGSIAGSVGVVGVVALVVIAVDASVRTVVRAFAGGRVASGISVTAVDHPGLSVLSSPLVFAGAAAVLGVAIVLLVPLLLREYRVSGVLAAVGVGLFAGGLVANQRWLAVNGAVVDVFAVGLPGGLVLVVSPADLAAVFGLGLVAMLALVAIVSLVAPGRRVPRAAAGNRART